jgi:hypothetical protein
VDRWSLISIKRIEATSASVVFDGSLLWGIRLRDLQVWERNTEILRVSTVSVAYSLADLIKKKSFRASKSITSQDIWRAGQISSGIC